jgi:hypothetical protein
MSTRAQVVIQDGHSKQWFYRHSDGYPEGAMPSLEKFLSWVKDGRIRDNTEQACGWLVIIGHQEYLEVDELMGRKNIPPYEPGPVDPAHMRLDSGMTKWKVGSYEPCEPHMHGDIEYLYTIDLPTRTIKVEEVRGFGNRQSVVPYTPSLETDE